MPVGASQQLSTVADLIVRINPQKTLDVGVGFGTYGMILREYLDLWDNVDETNPYSWKRTVDGIEICDRYISPAHKFLYDDIKIGDARNVIQDIEKKYDLVLLTDVIEHMTKKEGSALLSHILKITENVIITTPKKAKEQGAIYNNENERHISQWNEKDFLQFGECFFISDSGSIICCIGTAVPRLKKELLTFRRKMDSLFPFATTLYRKVKRALTPRPYL